MERQGVAPVVPLVLVVLLSHSIAVMKFTSMATNLTVTNTNFFPDQLDALTELYNAWEATPQIHINLQGWDNNSQPMRPCYNSDYTKNWRGVDCLPLKNSSLSNATNTDYDVRIVGLRLQNANINGTLPPAIWKFQWLTSIVMSESGALVGPIPTQNLSEGSLTLQYLDLHSNNLGGEIPYNLSQCQFLKQLDLSGNNFVGSLSNLNFSNMRNLRRVLIASNQLSGEIPPNTFADLTNLIRLDLSDNNFTGGLPNITAIPTLQIVNLSINQFNSYGDISSIVNGSVSTSLTTLDLSRTNFSYSSVSQLWSSSILAKSLKYLYLDGNSISGNLNIDNLLSSKYPVDTNGQLNVLSLKDNSIVNVIYSKKTFLSIDIRLQGNPYCHDANNTRDDVKRCLCGSGCFYFVDSSTRKIIIIAVSVSASFFVLVVVLAILSYYKIKKDLKLKHECDLQRQLQERFQEFDVKPTIFSYDELRVATRGFHPDMKVGEGGFGAVYKGILPNGNMVAVKQLFIQSEHGIAEFCNEVVLISDMKHRNLVKLKGCCLRETQRLLVYEYVENYDLQQALLERRHDELMNWPIRFGICVGIANGLHYLHALAKPRIIHRDIKASNILLDGDFQPKIADFGLVLLFPDEATHIITMKVAGTRGYLAPEYATLGQLSEKVDVYSFGVVLLEVISGRKNIDNNASPHQEYIITWAWKSHQENKLMDIVDHSLNLSANEELEVQRVINIALLCLQQSDEKRPTMAQVVTMLQGDQFDVAVGDLELSSILENNLQETLVGLGYPNSSLSTIRDETELPLFHATSSNGGSSSIPNVIIELGKISGR